jgi:two-component system phosphate regulon sensor histidine kinase PhoR
MDTPVADTSISAEKVELRVLPYGNDERLLLVRDVTKVERANQMRKDFVSNASHELRTPLTVMKGYVEMLLSSAEKNDTETSVPLKKVDLQVVKMQTMIEELLVLSRLEEGRVEDSSHLVDMRGLCEQIKSEYELAAKNNEQVLMFDIAPAINIKGNKASLQAVLRNLVANAIYYSMKGGRIYVSWSIGDNGDGVLCVKDSGQGIAARHLARLTERFYRVQENNVKNKTGTGLGLAIVKHELERHEARLIIDSKMGEGSRFQCIFPAVRIKTDGCH